MNEHHPLIILARAGDHQDNSYIETMTWSTALARELFNKILFQKFRYTRTHIRDSDISHITTKQAIASPIIDGRMMATLVTKLFWKLKVTAASASGASPSVGIFVLGVGWDSGAVFGGSTMSSLLTTHPHGSCTNDGKLSQYAVSASAPVIPLYIDL